MSVVNNRENKAEELKRGLYASYFSLTIVGLSLLVVGLVTNIWISNQALEVINVSSPKVALLEKINTSLETSRADLNAWIGGGELQFKINRKKAWQQDIYLALDKLKALNDDNHENLKKLEQKLRNVEMWQWKIEDVAQTQGNFPSQYLLDSQTKKLIKRTVNATTALIEIELLGLISSLQKHDVNVLIEFRANLFESLSHLTDYVRNDVHSSRFEFNRSMAKAEINFKALLQINKMIEVDQLEQLIIINENFKAYQSQTSQILTIREGNNWNIATTWVEQELNPKKEQVEKTLIALLNEERKRLQSDADSIKKLGTIVPFIMFGLLFLMAFVAFYLARKSTHRFVAPVVNLEIQDQLKSDVAVLNSNMLGVNNIKELCQNAIKYLAEQTQAVGGSLFVEQDNLLRLKGAYAVSNRQLLAHSGIELGEGLLGQAYINNDIKFIKPEPNDDFVIQSSLIEATPKQLMIAPIEFQGKVTAVIELASLHDFSDYEITFIKQCLIDIGASLNAVQQGELIRESLAKSQAQSEELVSQQEELRVTNEELENQKEELRVTNEELLVRGDAIQDKSDLLEQANKDLSEKSQNLELQANVLKKSEKELADKAALLEEASRYKSEFLANMSHELRTPLNSLLILAKMLADNDEENLNEDQVESASVIYDSGTHLLNLINDILDLSKIEAGRMDVVKETFFIAELAKSMEARFTHMAKVKGILFNVTGLDISLLSLITDGVKLQQILTNLIGNALKFTSEGSVTLDFSVIKNNEHDQQIAIAVIDTGIGIEETKQAAIFEAFQQEDGSINRNFGGTGLGLSISMAYSKLLGGHVQLKSKKGIGSTFTLMLPLNEQPIEDVVIQEPKPLKLVEGVKNNPEIAEEKKQSWVISPPPFTDDRERLKTELPLLLVVEDDPKFSRILYKEAQKQGYQCLVAPDAESGLILLDKHKVMGILLDLSLPRMDGKEFLKRVMDNNELEDIPVHIISALGRSGDELEQGAVGYFTKPVNQSQIAIALGRLMNTHCSSIAQVLLIEGDEASRLEMMTLLMNENIKITEACHAAEATEYLKTKEFNSIILGLNLPDQSGFEWLDEAANNDDFILPPVIIYSGRNLSLEEESHLKHYTESIIIKSSRSAERLLDEVSLFLNSVKRTKQKTPNIQKKINKSQSDGKGETPELKNKRVLAVDDDMRNTFALSKVLRNRGMVVEMASSGKLALQKLNDQELFDIVLMDIMMPDMDGYETMQAIRKIARFKNLPIIAVTAKAMKGDKEKCLEAGANDYLSKPIDIEKLQTTMLTWV